MDKKPLTFEIVRFIIYVVTLTIGIMLFYGAIDRRVTVIETELKFKVDDKKLFEKLDQLKEDISRKIETEIQKVKK